MPPSVVLIIIALQTEQSIVKLFFASVIPALLMGGLLIATILILCRIRPELGPAGPKTTFTEKIKSLFTVAEPQDLPMHKIVVNKIQSQMMERLPRWDTVIVPAFESIICVQRLLFHLRVSFTPMICRWLFLTSSQASSYVDCSDEIAVPGSDLP